MKQSPLKPLSMLVAKREFAFNSRGFLSQVITVESPGQKVQSVFLKNAFLKNIIFFNAFIVIKYAFDPQSPP